ncbi:MAG TPA: MFS transporter [Candidatus Pacearchaeota archaeon]|nr:MFS transporter [Candidatus Pacearchaeota archaeon]HOH04123.1 MFS transporter [Candidatus Pacearchaeota archaeon]HQC61176.1 MFS transporter [Candidatus Pacearchaeota archaeon]
MEEERLLKEQGKKYSLKDGASSSVMEGMGLKYITPYALSLGLSNKLIGILEVLPTLIANILRIFLSKAYYKKSRKNMVLPFIFIQAFFWIPLLLVGVAYFFFQLKLIYASLFLIICYSIIIISGLIASPAWTSWMQDLVETNRGEFFSKRSRINGFVIAISMITASIILDSFKEEKVFLGFILLFSLAAIGRYFSFHFLKKQYEPQPTRDDKAFFSFLQFAKKMHSNNFGRFVIFTSLMSFAVVIASPFFSVYMLKELQLSYFAFTLIVLSSLVSPIFFLSFIGKKIDKYGTVKVMKISGFLISFVPLLWIASLLLMNSPQWVLIGYLFAVEFFSGFVWAAYNLSVSNFIYDAVTKPKIILCFTYFGFVNSIGSFLGGLIGGQLSGSASFSIFGLGAILSVFLLSTVLRILPSIFILPKLKEVRQVETSKAIIQLKVKEKLEYFIKLITSYNPRPT